MKNPVIGITCSFIKKNNRTYDQVPTAYAEAVSLAGGLPFLIPNDFPIEKSSSLFEKVDGLLLSGGGDIEITRYNGVPASLLEVSVERDRTEFALLKAALELQKPVFGICRGVQVINVALGGTLYTDIPTQYTTQIIHSTPAVKGRDFMAHGITLELDSRLGRILGREQFEVNSFHHQGIQKLAPGLRVTARASDGLIEAVELESDPFKLIGVQWHPECLTDIQIQLELFKAFVAAC
jgi:putative glutamine amidotransferase